MYFGSFILIYIYVFLASLFSFQSRTCAALSAII